MSKSYKLNHEAIQEFLLTHPVVRARELRALGVDGCDLRRGLRRGWFRRVGRGLYVHRRAPQSADQPLLMAALRSPQATFCLETALHLHGLSEAEPTGIWLGLRAKARRPSIDSPDVRIIWLTGAFERLPVEVVEIDGVRVTLLTAAAAVVHAFARRDLVAPELAAESLCVLLGRDPLQEVLVARFAARCRVLGAVAAYLPGREFETDEPLYPAPPPLAPGATLDDRTELSTSVPPTTLPPEECTSEAA